MTSRSIFKTVCAIALTLVLGQAQAYDTPKVTQPHTAKITSGIYVGTSFFYYNNSMHGHVSNLLKAAATKQEFRSTSITIGGSGLDWHNVESYFAPNGIGRYSFVGNNEVQFNKLDKLWDIAIMMDCSQCPIHPQLQPIFYEYVKKHGDTVRSHGAEPMLFMSWAYDDKPEMTEPLAAEYVKAGNLNNMMVIPAGLAFAASKKARPDLNLYAPDHRHPSLAGTYLGASVVYASLFRQSPVGNPYTAGMDAATVAFLQNTAWDTVKSFYGIK